MLSSWSTEIRADTSGVQPLSLSGFGPGLGRCNQKTFRKTRPLSVPSGTSGPDVAVSGPLCLLRSLILLFRGVFSQVDGIFCECYSESCKDSGQRDPLFDPKSYKGSVTTLSHSYFGICAWSTWSHSGPHKTSASYLPFLGLVLLCPGWECRPLLIVYSP